MWLAFVAHIGFLLASAAPAPKQIRSINRHPLPQTSPYHPTQTHTLTGVIRRLRVRHNRPGKKPVLFLLNFSEPFWIINTDHLHCRIRVENKWDQWDTRDLVHKSVPQIGSDDIFPPEQRGHKASMKPWAQPPRSGAKLFFALLCKLY